ncbi:MAG TPA: CocE/NonD family hydrolase [Anaerolineales bacterium]|nr:CocE/NonD family hydrolase [Anaerolineales bacterium]
MITLVTSNSSHTSTRLSAVLLAVLLLLPACAGQPQPARAEESAFTSTPTLLPATPSVSLSVATSPAVLPETVAQPQPARIEEITFQSGEFTLVGDLWLPEGTAPFPVILLNQGSGLDNRIDRGFALPIMERMQRAGYATFSWDKPGVGESTGQLSDTRLLHERAQILLDAIEVMKARPDIDPHRIGLEGGSQAGYVMSLVLSMSEDIAFMICDSCPGMSGVDQSTYQAMALALCTGTPEGQADQRAELLADLDATRDYETYDQYAHYREVIEALFETASSAPKGLGFEVVPEEAWRLNDPKIEGWWSPMEVIRHTKIPVLVLLGDKDWQMDPLQAADAWSKALQAAGNSHSRVELFPDANHDLAAHATGCPDGDKEMFEKYVQSLGYTSLETAMTAIQENPELMNQFPFAPGYLDLIEEWLRGL